MANYAPIIIKNGELRQIEAADTLAIPGTLIIDGSVGVGCVPTRKLDIAGASGSVTALAVFDVSNSGLGLGFGYTPTYGYISSQSDIPFVLMVNGIEKIRLSSSGLIIGSGTAIVKVLSATATLNFPSHGAVSDLTMTVTGAAVGDPVFIGAPNGTQTAINSGVLYGWVSAADTVTIRQTTSGAGSTDAPSGTYRAVVFKF